MAYINQGYDYYSHPYNYDSNLNGNYPYGPETMDRGGSRNVAAAKGEMAPRDGPACPRSHQPLKVRFEEEPPLSTAARTRKMKGGMNERVDEEADSYITAKHKSFELRSWDTYRY